MGPGDRRAARVEPGRQPVVIVGTVEVVLNVFLATPHNLHRSAHVTRDLYREERAVMLESPAEAAADEMVVDLYRVFRRAGEGAETVWCPRRHLRADPDIAGVFRVVHGAVHRLHRGVGKERQLVNGIKSLRRAGERPLGVALIARHDAWLHRCLFELTDDGGAVGTRIRTVIPLNSGGLEAFLGSPQMVRDHRYGLVDRDD